MVAPLFKRWAPLAPVHQEPPTPSSAGAEAPPEAPRSAKKPKKRKRDVEAEDQAEETPKKHKAILTKYEKVQKLAESRGGHQADDAAQGPAADKEEEKLHDLQPIPQPAPAPEPTFEPTFSTLPTWLAKPVTVEATKNVPFTELGVEPFFVKKLERQGFGDALAVQSALLPMLHPGFEQHLGDICVSAKTGSGKTLAYLLPIIEALKDRVVPVLSAIVVVPSRQLVNQALQVAEELCAGTKIKVGTALGNVAISTEQRQLVKLRAQCDPRRAKELDARVSEQFQTGFVEKGGIFDGLKSMPLDHVPQYDSGVDILICTPGRLVEHIEHTTGFLLNDVRWLVIDEADQLLNQTFQGWASVLMDALHGETRADLMNAQERLRKRERDANSIWSIALPARRQITKIVLSATMEKDLTKLGTLKLKRPKLVLVQDEATEIQALDHEDNVFELPATLDELAVHVGDGSNKPLHLLHILLHAVFPGADPGMKQDTLAPSSDAESDTAPEEEKDGTLSQQANCVLIFTKSTESASRLAHLLAALAPNFQQYVKTMTRALTAEASRKLLRSFGSGTTKMLIASDAASRGLDIPSITHVINYDVPTSITSYVHRVGRTARAGKQGEAWTLFTKTEAAWFLNQVAKGEGIKRGNKKVRRIEWKESTVTAGRWKKAYRAALKKLEYAVTGAAAE